VPLILALDTATAILSLALTAGERRWYREIDAGLGHSELLMETADSLIRGAGLGPGDLEALTCMRGPGSFTGLRIGFSAAKGMALALDLPLIACPTLDCMAYPFTPWPGLVIPLMDAKKGRFFTALYREGRRISGEMDAGPGAVGEAALEASPGCDEPVLLTGPEAPLFIERLKETPGEAPARLKNRIRLDPLYRRGRALELAAVAKEKLVMDNERSDVSLGPEYLRKSDAER
jgi:tRNA threonylcarbamoyladenosine biosynthesis protein TsaB